MRNPSKNTLKKVMRGGWDYRDSNYFLFNEVGARIYTMSKGKYYNRNDRVYKGIRTSPVLIAYENKLNTL